ncbi:hypothetical protein ElyMa_004285800 [Elysia marginata]|uniref:Farnesoic acid O-methyl transferase domain-containing protein n=1 Tax=Elysia marginata TaxID=1093978 RepID=A0AAV4GW13_9GAST|nr:hypothetical protein ElyMa_004285800 [Elysia marginata]
MLVFLVVHLFQICLLIDTYTGACLRLERADSICLCEKISADEYHLTYNATSDTKTSNLNVSMIWYGRVGKDALLSDPYTFKQVITAKMSFIKFSSTFKKSQDFLVAGEDSTVLEFDVYGGEIYNIPDNGNAPQFYYVTNDGVEHKGCASFDRDTGTCINQTRTNDRCSCRKTSRCVYRISYTLSARQYVSKATVYLLWPGKANLRSDNFTLLQIKKSTDIDYLLVDRHVIVSSIEGQRGRVVNAADSRSGGRRFDSQPCHVAIALGKRFSLIFPSVHLPVKWVPSYRLQMCWSAGELVALLCEETVTLSSEDEFLERD